MCVRKHFGVLWLLRGLLHRFHASLGRTLLGLRLALRAPLPLVRGVAALLAADVSTSKFYAPKR